MIGFFHSNSLKLSGLVLGVLLLIAFLFSSIVFGVIETGWQTAVEAYTQFNGTNEHIVIREVRVPRALIATAVGASLGISGVLLQALTRNPLADLGVFGINSGASLCVVAGVSFFSIQSLTSITWIAFAGAALSGAAVYMLGSLGRDGLSALKITLAGSAVYALASSLTTGLLVANEKVLDEVLFWLAGSVAGRKLELLGAVFPYMAAAWVAAFLIARPVQTLSLGEDVAVGLGQRTLLVKLTAGLTIILLGGSSVAAAGPIAFVGLVVPHAARFLVGSNMRWTVAYSGVLGAILLLAADIAARFVAMPGELPIGAMTAILGGPFFVYIARKGISRT